ncbi:von Willebrand factor A domain-containing protein 8 [Agrilus planipennis]|uniref:von Willebrand factor A domain-containing protein 8 n=1 Tax=Agrilus planipennis TaxID=224129 RepID=A0A1W4X328_AGRPL|nr:von Willebrand factor A domain-containing protein 8 [Agrilus planipennis]
MGLPDFPVENLKFAVKILENNPGVTVHDVISYLYPYYLLPKSSIKSVEILLEQFKIMSKNKQTISLSNLSQSFKNLLKNKETKTFIETPYQQQILEKMLQSTKVTDLCVIGPKGCGKSILTSQLSNLVNKDTEDIVLYHDMTSRDLIQQRTTLENGDTVWRFSPLITAALEGKIAVLDGIHRIHSSTLSVLHRLVHDRELQLYDGKRLISSEKYDKIKENYGLSDEQLHESGILKIHSGFQIIALGEPPTTQGVTNWLTPEVISLFLFQEVRPLLKQEETEIISKAFGPICNSMKQLIELAHILRSNSDNTLKSLSGHLSTRQLLRIASRLSKFPSNDTYDIIQNTFMSKFLPPLARQALEKTLQRLQIFPLEQTSKSEISWKIEDDILTIGSTSCPIYKTDSITRIPSTLFYDIPQHLALMERILQDFLLGSHLLLVGNQGVGKNKVVDRFLELMNRPREYIQLHRDTTVQTLTTQPTIKDGVLVHEDSPLVKAVKFGHVLIVDEADKAPTHVTCILKTLVESGQMTLSDGRKIIKKDVEATHPNQIKIHPDFRMIVLANRPGFPFLGNDFFGALGDLFSCHAVDNPSEESEISLLKQYGPNVPESIIKTLVGIFGELRTMADQGLVAYPYSTREVVNIVKHLQKFPDTDLEDTLLNVLDFDKYSPEVLDTVADVLSKYGFRKSVIFNEEYYAKKRAKEKLKMSIERKSGLDTNGPKHGKEDPKNEPHVGGNTWAGGTGGRDTAGLGGKGGPYRLDKGHQVHQLSDEEKAAVPEHVRKAAQEMGRKAFQERLKEIGMSGYDASLYAQLSNAVAKEVQSLRVILNTLQSKNKERQWSRHQTSGELDDVKLIDGLLGEKTVFRRRIDQQPEPGTPQIKSKRLRLVVDVSGSMYRFNGYDGRLERELEAVILLMEAMKGFEDKIEYDIMGHSGEEDNIVFVKKKEIPKNNKERLDVIQTMHAHSQFCLSGDHTLQATQLAVKSLAEEDCDEAIVVILSDANLQRYGIKPADLGAALTAYPNVNAYAVFIGSLGDQAER